jgi:hypothetical protein
MQREHERQLMQIAGRPPTLLGVSIVLAVRLGAAQMLVRRDDQYIQCERSGSVRLMTQVGHCDSHR